MKPVRTDLIMSTFKIPVWPSRALSTLLVALALLWTATSARAQTSGAPPERIAYQGFLTDGSGTALGATTPKNYDVTVKIYTAPTGGACVWAETQTVTVDRGNFSPNRANAEFVGKTFTDMSGPSGSSGHATFVAQNLYGTTTSIAPGISRIWLYEAGSFAQGAYLNFGQPSLLPATPPGGTSPVLNLRVMPREQAPRR